MISNDSTTTSSRNGGSTTNVSAIGLQLESMRSGSTSNVSSIDGQLRPNHGKPYTAPKPPYLQLTVAARKSDRPVARHQSMKTMRLVLEVVFLFPSV